MKRLLFLLFLMIPLFCSCVHEEIVRYDPPGMIVVTESGEHWATRFGYRWERERKGDAVDFVEPDTYEEYEPIAMHAEEACYLRFGEGIAPEMYIIRFYPADGAEKRVVDYTINYHGNDPRYAENYSVLLPPVTQSGIYTVEAVWPEWITNSVVTDATYGFEVSVSDAD